MGIVDMAPEVLFFSVFWTLLVKAELLSRMDVSRTAIRRSTVYVWVGIVTETLGALLFIYIGVWVYEWHPEWFENNTGVGRAGDTFSSVFLFEGIFNAVSLLCVCIVTWRVFTNTRTSDLLFI
ncbi:hypothetical protein KIPB_012195 [Kipferlia bialata]|uniref:Uncharacterized protein n=1 Tax=Kipferlia bialata TaxID=797122 RepID=A0A9K3D5V2_9EUKA|nr:hypothetical protein KIPB_012195 [Kipferlia bialata]|eukprot:g12195.t1